MVSSDLDANVRGVMPEEEPAEDGKDEVASEERVAFQLDCLNHFGLVILHLIVNQLLDDALKVEGRGPERSDSAEDTLSEPVVQDHETHECDTCFEES